MFWQSAWLRAAWHLCCYSLAAGRLYPGKKMQHPSPDRWAGVEAGSWTPLPYHTGTPLWYRNGQTSPTSTQAMQSHQNLNFLFSTLGGPPPPVPTDLSQPFFLGQLRALKTERDILERQLEEARVARVEAHMWNAPLQWAGLRPVGSASRGWTPTPGRGQEQS